MALQGVFETIARSKGGLEACDDIPIITITKARDEAFNNLRERGPLRANG